MSLKTQLTLQKRINPRTLIVIGFIIVMYNGVLAQDLKKGTGTVTLGKTFQTHNYSSPVLSDSIPMLTIISPKEGDTWIQGENSTITWESEGVERVKIYYSSSSFPECFSDTHLIADLTDTSSDSFIFSSYLSGDASIKITGTTGNLEATDQSTINVLPNEEQVSTFLRLTSPKGGQWKTGNLLPITWESEGIEKVTILYHLRDPEYSIVTCGKFKWEGLASNVNALDGEYYWRIPIIHWYWATDKCGMMIYASENPTLFSFTGSSSFSNFFSIVETDTPSREFRIFSVQDVPNDQGGMVSIAWGSHEQELDNKIDVYRIWRKVDSDIHASDNEEISEEWELVKEVSSSYSGISVESLYVVNVPTMADYSVTSGEYYSVFYIEAGKYSTHPDSGYSVDNLSPQAVKNITIEYRDSGNFLKWDDSDAPDISHYEVHRGDNEIFTPNESTLIHKTNETFYLDNFLKSGNIFYRIIVYDMAGNSGVSDNADVVVKVYDKPDEFYTSAPYPNPFNPTTTIQYDIPEACHVELIIYDVLGRKITTLQNDVLNPGMYQTIWDGTDKSGKTVSSGLYIYRLRAGEYTQSNKMMLMR